MVIKMIAIYIKIFFILIIVKFSDLLKFYNSYLF